MAAKCPQCNKDDMIQKISSLYDAGISTTNYQAPVAIQVQGHTVYGSVSRSASSRTALAQKLQPPIKPKEPGGGNLGLILGFVGGLFGVIVFSILFPNIFRGASVGNSIAFLYYIFVYWVL